MRIATVVLTAVLACASIGSGQEGQAQLSRMHSFGIGLGVPYGGVGINGDYGVSRHVSLTGGFGHSMQAGPGYAVGARMQLRGPDARFRPRVFVVYGTNAYLRIVIDGEEETTTYSGVSTGAGFRWTFGASNRHGFDLDVIYVATSGYDGDTLKELGAEENGRIKISLGYRYVP